MEDSGRRIFRRVEGRWRRVRRRWRRVRRRWKGVRRRCRKVGKIYLEGGGAEWDEEIEESGRK